MPDISMCTNSTCLIRMDCYRFRAIPCMYQSYSIFNPTNETPYCDSFIPIDDVNVMPIAPLEEGDE